MTTADVVRLTGLSKQTLWRARKRGELDVVKVGKRVLIEPVALRRFLDSHRVSAGVAGSAAMTGRP